MRVKNVVYLDEYKLKLLFSDGKKKIVDLNDIIKDAIGILLPLKNIEYFKQVALDDCQFTICWPNGADLCPDVLYEIGKEIPKIAHKTYQKRPKRTPLKL
jgi:Protein of unknown function (DUF2442)